MGAEPTPRLCSLADAAAILGVPKRTLYQLCVDGRLGDGVVRIGGKWWLKAATVEHIAEHGVPDEPTEKPND